MPGKTSELTITSFDPAKHDRQGFSCGEPSLDVYLQTQATQDVKRRAAALYVATNEEQAKSISGYYTLSACSVLLTGIPINTQKKLARYPDVPGALIGRLAVDNRYKGTGLGAALLGDALQRCLDQSQNLAIAVVVVDALNDSAERFYERYGFLLLDGTSAGRRLFLPLATLRQAQS